MKKDSVPIMITEKQKPRIIPDRMKEYIERTAGNIEVFRTGIEDTHTARKIEQKLLQHYSDCRIDFDLEDCDNVMRIEVPEGTVDCDQVIELVSGYGCSIEILP